MSFRITGLSPAPFRELFGRSDDELRARGAIRYVADSKPGFPDRVTLRDAEIGETVLLLNYEHQPARTPFRASHAIFVLEHATQAYDRANEIPETFRTRLMSLRGFDAEHMIVEAEAVDGWGVEAAILDLFSDPRIAYVHAHYAKRGCFAARIDRR